MKKTLFVLFIAAALLSGTQASAQAFNSKLKIGSKEIITISSSSPAYKDIIQAGVTVGLTYYQHSANDNPKGNANLTGLLASLNEHFKEDAGISTLFTLNQGVMIDGEMAPAGTYGMFTTINGQSVILLF